VAVRNSGSLHIGQGIGNVARLGRLSLKALADAVFVDTGSLGCNVKTCVAQQVEADGRAVDKSQKQSGEKSG